MRSATGTLQKRLGTQTDRQTDITVKVLTFEPLRTTGNGQVPLRIFFRIPHGLISDCVAKGFSKV